MSRHQGRPLAQLVVAGVVLVLALVTEVLVLTVTEVLVLVAEVLVLVGRVLVVGDRLVLERGVVGLAVAVDVRGGGGRVSLGPRLLALALGALLLVLLL